MRNNEKNELKPWLVEEWCIPEASAEFVAKMEDVLAVYERPYDPLRPVVCIDEMIPGGDPLPQRHPSRRGPA